MAENGEKKSLGKIMVVDDDQSIRDFIRLSFESKGYDVIEAHSAIQALKILDSEIPDLILLDIMLPVMNGYEMCRKVKDDPVLKSIPIMFVTAYVEKDSLKKSVQAGAQGFIEKPLMFDDLLKRVEDGMKGHFVMPTQIRKQD